MNLYLIMFFGTFFKLFFIIPISLLVLFYYKLYKLIKNKKLYLGIILFLLSIITYTYGVMRLSVLLIHTRGAIPSYVEDFVTFQSFLNVVYLFSLVFFSFGVSMFLIEKVKGVYRVYFSVCSLFSALVYLASVILLPSSVSFKYKLLLSLYPVVTSLFGSFYSVIYFYFRRYFPKLSAVAVFGVILIFISSILSIYALCTVGSKQFAFARIYVYATSFFGSLVVSGISIIFIYRVEKKLRIIGKYSDRSIENVIKLVLLELSQIIGTGSEAIIRLAMEKFVRREKKAVLVKDYMPMNLDKIEKVKFLAYLLESIELVVGKEATVAILRNVYKKNRHSKALIIKANRYVRTPNSVEQFLRELKSKK